MRWRDVDLDAGTIAVRRSVGMVKVKGEPDRLVEGPTKNGKARVVAIDEGTAGLLRTYRKGRAAAAFVLGSSDALVFGNIEGGHRLPDSFSWYFADAVKRCNRMLTGTEGLQSVEALPVLHLHSLRHTAATLLLSAGTHPKVVQERLGHQTISITMDTYSHALPSMQKDAADVLGQMLHAISQ